MISFKVQNWQVTQPYNHFLDKNVKFLNHQISILESQDILASMSNLKAENPTVKVLFIIIVENNPSRASSLQFPVGFHDSHTLFLSYKSYFFYLKIISMSIKVLFSYFILSNCRKNMICILN